MADDSVSVARGRKRKAGDVDREKGALEFCTACSPCPGHSKRSARRNRAKKRKLDEESAGPKTETKEAAASDSDAEDGSGLNLEHGSGDLVVEASAGAALSDADDSHADDDSASDADAASDGGDGSDAFEAEEEPARPRGRPKSVIELSKALFEGSQCSLVQGIELLLQLQTRHKLSDAAMGELFDVLRLLLPNSNLVTFAVAKRVILDLGSAQLQFVDCCVNDCVLFRNADLRFDAAKQRQFATLQACPVCKEQRLEKGKARKVALDVVFA